MSTLCKQISVIVISFCAAQKLVDVKAQIVVGNVLPRADDLLNVVEGALMNVALEASVGGGQQFAGVRLLRGSD